MAITKGGLEIRTLDEWARLAGPKSEGQWVDGRSAKEVARAWLAAGGKLPEEVEAALTAQPCFGRVDAWRGEPEVRLPFDALAGEPRNTDLLIHATDHAGPFLIAVEAKADEPFGDLLGDTMCGALERRLANKRSRGLARAESLALSLFGSRNKGEPALSRMRYQLMTACAGLLAEARRIGVGRAIMLVQEFVTSATDPRNRDRNSKDLDCFVHRLSRGSVRSVSVGQIYGPFKGESIGLEQGGLFVGKVARDLALRQRDRQGSI